MVLPLEPHRKENKNDKEEDDKDQQEEEEEPLSHLNLIWDEVEIGVDDDDNMEEACVGHDYNLHSKGSPNSNDSPSTMKTNTNKTTTTTTFTSKQTSTDKSPKKSPISLDFPQKILGDLKLDYDVVEDLKKMRANITIFELCKIT